MIEREHWHPVASADALGAQPLAARLLGEDLVLWREADGAPHAWPDRCPHRGAKLSLGRVQGGRLECPYQGWQFEASGQCVRVPALPAFQPPATHCVHAFAAREAYGLVWVRLAEGNVDMPCFGAEADVRLRKLNCGPYIVDTGAPRIVLAVPDWRESIAMFLCPVDEERSIAWSRLAVADFDSPDEKLRAFQDTIFRQDQPVLESQSPKRLPLDLRAELHTPADRASSAYRRYLSRLGITFGVSR